VTDLAIVPLLAQSGRRLNSQPPNSCLAESARIGYRATMSVMLRQIARYVVRKVASNPVAREKAAKIARGVVAEAKQIAKKKNRAYAAGRAVRRALNKL
jgi:hypothetical protein